MALSASEESGLNAAAAGERPRTRRNLFGFLTNETALLSLSVANLCFLYVWKEILGLSSDSGLLFMAVFPPGYAILLAIAADVLCLAVLVFGFLWASEARKRLIRILARTLFGFLCLTAIYEPLAVIASSLVAHRLRLQAYTVIVILVGFIALWQLVANRRRTISAFRIVLLILSPVFPVLLANGLVHTYSVRKQWPGNGSPAGMLPEQKSRQRFIWVLFDELDRRMLFDARPKNLSLPQFDRLRSEAIDASKAESPAKNTPVAVPSLLSQKRMECVKAARNGELLYRPPSSRALVPFAAQNNIFKIARERGYNAGAAGWMLPYCRLFGKYMSDCAGAFCGFEVPFVQRALLARPFLANAVYLAEWQAMAIPYMAGVIVPKPEQGTIFREGQIESYETVLQNATRMLKNRGLNLVFLHLPVPHPPGIWDPKRSTLTTGDSDYLDNLQLADRVMGQIRKTLEEAGDWQRSTILVSSDHPFRASNWTGEGNRFESERVERITGEAWFPYVPFLLKLPFETQAMKYAGQFNTILTSELVFEVLEGHVKTPDAAVAWLESNGARLSQSAEPMNNNVTCE